MPNSRGWAALGVSIALLVLWAGFGETELMTTALFLVAAVVVGLMFVRIVTPTVAVDRALYPPNAHEGDTVVVEIHITAGRRLRNVYLEDTVHGLGVARFAAAKASPGQPLVARYEVMCRERGAYTVGPADVTITDPFGLTERRGVAGGIDHLLIYPRTEKLRGFPAVRGFDPAVQSTRPTFAPSGGDDFFTLREYQVGDDLRKVHWPSSAKRDDLMIRQLEVPWQARALILLDCRADRYPTREAFEQAVRGAASATGHLHREGFSPELWTGVAAPGVRSGNRYLQAMDMLATVQPDPGLDLRRMVARLRRHGVGGGALIMVTGVPDDASLAAYRALARDFTRTVVMLVTDTRGEAITMIERTGAVTVVTEPDGYWSQPWRVAMERSWATASAG